jgi:hypothetical protein
MNGTVFYVDRENIGGDAMMSFTTITQSTSTPAVSFDPVERKMLITGESYPENSFAFYGPIAGWVKEYLGIVDELNLEINVSYMNSSSTKCMLDLLDLFEDAYLRGLNVSITWRYDRENPRSFDLAEEFKEEVTLPFSIIPLGE